MNSRYKSFFALLYICSFLSIALFIMILLSSWIGGGKDIVLFSANKLFGFLKWDFLREYVSALFYGFLLSKTLR